MFQQMLARKTPGNPCCQGVAPDLSLESQRNGNRDSLSNEISPRDVTLAGLIMPSDTGNGVSLIVCKEKGDAYPHVEHYLCVNEVSRD